MQIRGACEWKQNITTPLSYHSVGGQHCEPALASLTRKKFQKFWWHQRKASHLELRLFWGVGFCRLLHLHHPKNCEHHIILTIIIHWRNMQLIHYVCTPLWQANLKLHISSFALAAPHMWNKLSSPLRQVDSVNTFKRQLKIFLLAHAF